MASRATYQNIWPEVTNILVLSLEKTCNICYITFLNKSNSGYQHIYLHVIHKAEANVFKTLTLEFITFVVFAEFFSSIKLSSSSEFRWTNRRRWPDMFKIRGSVYVCLATGSLNFEPDVINMQNSCTRWWYYSFGRAI